MKRFPSLSTLVLCLVCVGLVCAERAAADADGWRLRPGDRPFAPTDLSALPGRAFVFFDDGEARFGPDGAYSYTLSAANGGGTSWGSYHIAPDGSVCIDFVTGFSRCDLYVHNGSRVILITKTGQRFPAR